MGSKDLTTIETGMAIGDNATIGPWATIGSWVTTGLRLTWCDLKIQAWMCLSNVDGTGRQVKVLVHTDGIAIEAGCFFGSLDEFCEKALSEGKTRYAKVVRAAAEALQSDVIEKGITGGWDDEEETPVTGD